MSKNYAFTLAEVLITLSIIGIVAALTIPSLIAEHQEKETVAKLKKFSSVMSQAMTLAIQNEGEIESWGLEKAGMGNIETDEELLNDQLVRNKFFEIITKYVKYAKYCPYESECAKQTYTRYSLDGTEFWTFSNKILLADGTSIVDVTIANPNCKSIFGTSTALQNVCGELFVDINGKKGPNATGKDVFLFYFTKSGYVIPKGTAEEFERGSSFSHLCNRKTTDRLNGYGCTAWVMYNENMDYLKCDDLSWNGKHTCK